MFSAAEFEEFLLAFPTEVTFCGAGGAASSKIASRDDAERMAQLYLFATGQPPLRRSDAGSAGREPTNTSADEIAQVAQGGNETRPSELCDAMCPAAPALPLEHTDTKTHSIAAAPSSRKRKKVAARRRAQVDFAATPFAPSSSATLTAVELDDPKFLSTMLQDIKDIKAMLAFEESLKPAEVALLALEPDVIAALKLLDSKLALAAATTVLELPFPSSVLPLAVILLPPGAAAL